MRDPILQEKRVEHVQFQKYALELMEGVSGKPTDMDTTLANIHKANVVAQTKITYNEQQLYLLIYQHLVDRGFSETAMALSKEAKLTPVPKTPSVLMHHHSPFAYRSPIVSRSRIRSKTADSTFLAPFSNVPGTSNSSGTSSVEQTPTPSSERSLEFPMEQNQTLTPIKLVKKNPATQNTNFPNNQRTLEKQDNQDVFLAPTAPGVQLRNLLIQNNNVTLDTIVTEYLTNQHALCKNPMSTCPQFDLFKPHKCPDQHMSRSLGLRINNSARLFTRQMGFDSRKLDRKFVHSQFHVQRTLRGGSEPETVFTCCDFMPTDQSVLVGCANGEVRVFNVNDGNEDFSFQCHESYVHHIKNSRDGKLVITASSWRSPLIVLWSLDNKQFISKMQFEEEEYLEFSNLTQDKVLGTKGETAVIYDVNTGQKIKSLVPTIFNQYNKNRATFCPTDELILSDGVLWDFKSGVQIHKFDKLNNTLSGVFHPNGLEVISNTEVWDLRTFHLLRTIPNLDQCQLKFSPQNVIYGYSIETDSNPEDDNQGFDSSFKTLDSYDYSSISTTDVRKSIYDLSINRTGYMIALCENQGCYESVSESVVRIYNVGRKRIAEDEAEEEEEEVGSDDDASEDGSMSGSDLDNGEYQLYISFFII